MIKIIIIGTGNLGTELCKGFERSNSCKLVGYFNRSNRKIDHLKAPLLENFNVVPACDIILLCTPDDVIATVSAALNTTAIVAHTSGSVALSAVSNHQQHGVFYLPQSFSSSRNVQFEDLIICLEASSNPVMEQLKILGSSLSRKHKHLDSMQRKRLHLAAVYANNFVNHCYLKTQELLEREQLDLAILEPLLRETLEKALAIGPLNAQTGPAKRSDFNTIETHKNMLETTDRDMYETITRSILKTYGTEL
jgi:predicted short-subunit dehydrogenase-like oxidoreductase (DUF2520 family)